MNDKRDALLNDIKTASNLAYLSDLHLDCCRNRVTETVQTMPHDAYGLSDWQYAMQYITGYANLQFGSWSKFEEFVQVM